MSHFRRFYFFPLLLALFLGAGAGDASAAVRIAVFKGDHRLELQDSQGRVLAQYPVALGRHAGAKRRQGDGKTPEGHYAVAAKNTASRFHKALRVSYPNAEDSRRAREAGVSPGGDIMIHGIQNGLGWIGSAQHWIDWTNGCIALSDRDMDRLWRDVPVGTAIDIYP